jgi:hypothetical protein
MSAGDFAAARQALTEALQRALVAQYPFFTVIAFYYFAELLALESHNADLPLALEQKSLAVALLSCVRTQPATWQIYRDKAAHLQAEIERILPAEMLATAIARGQACSLEELASSLQPPDPASFGKVRVDDDRVQQAQSRRHREGRDAIRFIPWPADDHGGRHGCGARRRAGNERPLQIAFYHAAIHQRITDLAGDAQLVAARKKNGAGSSHLFDVRIFVRNIPVGNVQHLDLLHAKVFEDRAIDAGSIGEPRLALGHGDPPEASTP